MTLVGQSANESDPVWQAALDWLMRVQAAPNDVLLSEALKEWLAASESHMRAYHKAEKVWRLTGDVGPAQAHQWRPGSEVFVAGERDGRMLPKPRQPPAGTRLRSRWVRLAPSIAAAVVLLLMPMLWLAMKADYRTGTAEMERVVLADGSVAHLDAKSALAVRYSASKRAVELLSGQTFFDVRADAARPFVVHVGKFAVTVVGTAFDVRLTDDALTVSVARGAVQVSGLGLSGPPLEPGAQLTVALKGPAPALLERVPVSTIAAWREGRLMIHDAPIAEVVEALRRHYAGVIVLADDLKSHRVTGIYDLRRPVQSLAAVVQPFGGVVDAWTPYVMVVSAKEDP